MFRNLAAKLKQATTPNPMPSQGRSALVQMLMAQSMRSPNFSTSLAESANIAAPQLLAALLARNEDKARQKQSDFTSAKERALATALTYAGQQGPYQQMFKDTALQTAGALPDNPLAQALLGQQAQQAFAGPGPRDIREGADGEFVEFFSDGRPPQVIRQATAKPESSDDITEYNYAVKNDGYTGSFEEWMKGQREAGASKTTVDVGDNRIPDVVLKSAVDSSNRADMLRSQVNELAVFRDLAKDTETSGTAPITKPIKEIFQGIGINLDENLPMQQAFLAQQRQMSLRLRNPESGFGLTGNTSNRDITFLTESVASLGNTPEANDAILTIMMAKQRREAQLEDLKSEYIFSTGSLQGWGKVRDEFVNKNPFLTEDEQVRLQSLKRSAIGRTVVTDPSSLTDEQLQELAK